MLGALQGDGAEDCRAGEGRDGAVVPDAVDAGAREGRDGGAAGLSGLLGGSCSRLKLRSPIPQARCKASRLFLATFQLFYNNFTTSIDIYMPFSSCRWKNGERRLLAMKNRLTSLK